MLGSKGFRSSLEVLRTDERAVRESLTKNRLSFGIRYLDDALRGIIATDLVLIGAGTGVGKTELASNIGFKNAAKGKRVYGIFLEAFQGEIELRQKYRLLAREALQYDLKPNYADWIMGDQPWLDEFSSEINLAGFENFHTKYRDKNYSIETLERDLLSINESADLIIVDHLHYFDITDNNENRGLTNIVKTISDVIQVIQCPVILVAHLRKTNDQFASPLPQMDDFHGTSNITKIATKVVLMGKGNFTPQHTYTYMRAAKYRLSGQVPNYVAACKYSHQRNDYEADYQLGQLSFYKPQGEWSFEKEAEGTTPSWYTKPKY